ncbi:MAG: class I mannose-6-phosphate isomerase [Treponemataceae bacterium]
MSFMFSPCRYNDPNPVNSITVDVSVSDAVVTGAQAAANAIAKNVAALIGEKGRCVFSLDGYPGAELDVFLNLVEQSLRPLGFMADELNTKSLYKPAEALEEMLAENLPEDRVMDPVLLYGRLYHGGYEGLMDEKSLQSAVGTIRSFRQAGKGALIISGFGSLIGTLSALADIRCWVDIAPKQAILNIRDGRYVNVGDETPRHFKQMMRRCYYVDFECAQAVRRQAIAGGALDWYICGDAPDAMAAVPAPALKKIFSALAFRPLRCRPVYLKGVWGGHYLTRMRGLPESIDNCAWCFDFIPMEVSLVAEFFGKKIEIPFYTLLQAEGRNLMGDECVKAFKGYFPIRFNYDDTWHSNGNMSIQVHPDEDYAVKNNNELGRQDESYYIVEAAQDAKTYLGFKDGADTSGFLSEIFRSEREHAPIDYAAYVNAVPSKPGLQIMIPAGTIHASGRNQLVLEIGSLTVGSYTYKMYDYLRSDLDGSPRPIHSRHGANVLRTERTASWVEKNLVQTPTVLREGADYVEKTVGRHDLLYFCLRTVSFATTYPDDTSGRFHVLTLVNGERVRVESIEDPRRCYVLSYLDIILVPASVGAYRVVNLGNQPATIHKTLLKDGFEHAERK